MTSVPLSYDGVGFESIQAIKVPNKPFDIPAIRVSYRQRSVATLCQWLNPEPHPTEGFQLNDWFVLAAEGPYYKALMALQSVGKPLETLKEEIRKVLEETILPPS